MTDNTQPEALQLAQFFERMKKSSHRWHDGTPVHEKAAAELRRQHARIAELEARIKTMAEEHADELMVAHMDGRMRAAQPAGAQQPGTAYAELPSYEHQRAIMEAERNAGLDEYSRIVLLTSTESRIYERAFTNGWNRRASHGQAPAQAAPQQEPSHTAVQLAELVLSDCGHSSNYTPLLDRVAARIDSHTERRLDELRRCLESKQAPQADSVTAPASGANWQDISTAPKDGTRFVAVGQNYGLDSEKQHTCIAQWLAGCWVEVSDWNGASKLKYLTHWMPLPPLPGSAARAPADSVLEDAARLEFEMQHGSAIAAARKQGANHD